MKKEINIYNELVISGKLLIPGFSIYLLEIIFEKRKLYYIGMTGDNFYPSARAAFHRISGHLELTTGSTQNQLMTSLIENGINETNFAKLLIKMYSFPIKGFRKWEKTRTLKASLLNKLKNTPEYKDYKNKQREVQQLENKLIYDFKKQLNENLLNKTKGIDCKLPSKFNAIYDNIFEIIQINEKN